MRNIGICTSSRSERHLMEALHKKIPNSELMELPPRGYMTTPTIYHNVMQKDFIIIPADRSEMTEFALYCFHNNIPFCHYLAGSQSFSYCHDDINRWIISLMASFLFAESPEAAENLKRVGIPEDRILVTGTSHFDGITNYDIEASKPTITNCDVSKPYDVILMNPTTQTIEDCYPHRGELITTKQLGLPPSFSGKQVIAIEPNEDEPNKWQNQVRQPHLQYLWLLKHCDHFISNSSTTVYEVPYLNKFCGANIKIKNPSKRNAERTPIDPMYCKGASAKIAKWCEEVDLEWLKTPKRLWMK